MKRTEHLNHRVFAMQDFLANFLLFSKVDKTIKSNRSILSSINSRLKHI